MRVLMHAPGPQDHGAVRHARTVASLVREKGADVIAGCAAPTRGGEGRADLTHSHFTDALWGRDVHEATKSYEAWASGAPRPIVVTLHDVPGADPDRRRDARRAAGYARVLAASDGAIVSSLHEAAKVCRLGDMIPRFIELPIPRPADTREMARPPFPWAGNVTIGLLGFLYPGKGHAEAIDAAGRRSPCPLVVSLGAVSPGHDALRRELSAYACSKGVELLVTGFLPSSALAVAAAAVTVPLAPNRLVSASASLLTWVGFRRRPITAAGAYGRELAARHPGAVELYETSAELDCAIDAAICGSAPTRSAALSGWPDVGALHLEAYEDLLRRSGMASVVR